MKIKDILKDSARPFPSLEIVPPMKGITNKELIESVRPFMEFNPRYINVTCHRDEYEYREEMNGTFSRHLVRNKVSEVAVCCAIMTAYKIDVVPHMICGGSTADEIDNKLSDLKFLGIENIMALRGDCTAGEKRFTPTAGGYRYADELVSAIRNFEKGNGIFSIGVGGYPEKHFEAPNMETDIANLKKKVDAGADYISIHSEKMVNEAYRAADHLHQKGKKIGTVLAPETPVDAILPYVECIDKVTVMTIYPGYAGARLIPQTVSKITELVQLRAEKGLSFLIDFDGAGDKEHIGLMKKAGTDLYVIGKQGLFALDDDLDRAAQLCLDYIEKA